MRREASVHERQFTPSRKREALGCTGVHLVLWIIHHPLATASGILPPMYCISHVHVHFDYLQAAHRIISTHLYHPQITTNFTSPNSQSRSSQPAPDTCPSPSTNNPQFQRVHTLAKQNTLTNRNHVPPPPLLPRPRSARSELHPRMHTRKEPPRRDARCATAR